MIEVLKQALEALENVTEDYVKNRQYKHNKAMDALRQAIAKAEKQDEDCQQCGGKGCVACDAREQEPVQVTIKDFVKAVKGKEEIVGRPVYWAQWPNGDTHPQPKREPPTHEDFLNWYDNAIWGNEDFKQGCWIAFEAGWQTAHGIEKNT